MRVHPGRKCNLNRVRLVNKHCNELSDEQIIEEPKVITFSQVTTQPQRGETWSEKVKRYTTKPNNFARAVVESAATTPPNLQIITQDEKNNRGNGNSSTKLPILIAENIQILFNWADSLPLYVDVTVEGYSDTTYDCLVYNRACVSRIKSSVVDNLSIGKHPSPIWTIIGLGPTAIKISYFVTLILRFRSTTNTEFYAVTSEFLEDSPMLGVSLLQQLIFSSICRYISNVVNK